MLSIVDPAAMCDAGRMRLRGVLTLGFVAAACGRGGEPASTGADTGTTGGSAAGSTAADAGDSVAAATLASTGGTGAGTAALLSSGSGVEPDMGGSPSTTSGNSGGVPDPPASCPPMPCVDEADCPGPAVCVDPFEDAGVEDSDQKYCLALFDAAVHGCDVHAQDCPEGFKCVHTIYNETESACVPVMEGATPVGSACEKLTPCLIYPSTDIDNVGLSDTVPHPDTCDADSQCFFGTCRQLCTFVDWVPSCPEGYACNGGRVSLWCVKTCDPLADDCPAGEQCYSNYKEFFCYEGEEGVEPLFATCFGNDCADGLACIWGAATECADSGQGCCTPYCDLLAPTCPGVGQECVSWDWEPFEPGPGFEHLGYCTLPA